MLGAAGFGLKMRVLTFVFRSAVPAFECPPIPHGPMLAPRPSRAPSVVRTARKGESRDRRRLQRGGQSRPFRHGWQTSKHIEQAVFRLKGKITYFIDTVLNYLTLAECYKTAAFNGLNRLT